MPRAEHGVNATCRAVFPVSDLAEPDMEGHHHVAFGFGVHQCRGHNLARAELAVAPHTLFDRLPT